MMMRTLLLIAAALAVSASPAFADGKKGRLAPKVPKLQTGHVITKTPCPLGPGDRFTTGEKPTGKTYNCGGAFVVTDNIASSVTLPDGMETVAPIIHRAGQPDPCGRPCPPEKKAEVIIEQPAEARVMTVKLSDNFGTGGVGANISGGSSGARVYVVSGGGASAHASAGAYAFAFASASAFAGGGGGGHSCGCR
jgi:hypothetical protein